MTGHNDVRIVGLCGSLGDDSGTRVALSHALDSAADTGGRTELVDLREYELPRFDSDAPDVGDAEELRSLVRDADGILLGTPMYHGSYSSVIKNALDYCEIEDLEDKSVGLLAVSGGQFPMEALGHLRGVCRALNAVTVPHEVAIPGSYEQFEDGEVLDEAVAERLTELGEEIVRYVQRTPEVPA